MNGTVFFKMSGSGNDFVFVDGRHSPVEGWSAEQITGVCARATGVGADGFVVLEPGSGPGAVRFHFFNNDGSPAPMCGNGALCATRLAAWLELAPPEGMTLETDSGAFQTRCVPGTTDRVEMRLSDVGVTYPEIGPEPGEGRIAFATVGVPHLVVVVDDVDGIDVARRGRALRMDPALRPKGANINFVSRAGSGWTMRTYERGVEAETLACGTGAVACAAVLGLDGQVNLPWDVLSRLGLTLSVDGALQPDSDPPGLSEPRLVGQARLAFRGVIEFL